MKKSYGKSVATHTDPESCGVTCKGDVEALTGGSSRQGCESGWVKVPAPSIACVREAESTDPPGRGALSRSSEEVE